MIVFIFRRDLRLRDNTGLIEAYKTKEPVLPIFIFTPQQVDQNDFFSENAFQFMIESLEDLSRRIPLVCYYGDHLDILSRLINQHRDITGIFTNTDYTPFAIQRDQELSEFCNERGIDFRCYDDVIMFPRGDPIKPYLKFTPYYNAYLKQQWIKPSNIKVNKFKKITDKHSVKLSSFKKHTDKIVVGGETEGYKLLRSLKSYDPNTNLDHGTSHLSAYIKFGNVSIRDALIKFHKKHPFTRQLIWREFYYQCFDNFKSFRYPNIKWNQDHKAFKMWTQGTTGFPVVDAAMNQLNHTGFMHNRGRLIVASFLVKTLGIDWKWGEQYFASKLTDYDPIVNNGNWQWVAGTGADVQPYFRIFNPWIQGKKFDPQCVYIKKWVPKLKDVPNDIIHNWFEHYDESIYYKPIVDFAKSKVKILKMYKNKSK